MDVEDVYDQEAEQEGLAAIVERWYRRMLVGMHELVASAFVAELSAQEFRLDDASTRVLLNEAAERVVRIDQTTQEAIREQLKEGQQRGYSTHELAYGVPGEDYRGIDHLYQETWKGRAELVAFNELAEAQHRSALNRYAATGLVEEVQLVEHEDTDAPCASRNGKIVLLSSNPQRLHVGCRLGTIPVLRE